MASRYEKFVASQRKRAEQIREQALSGTLNSEPAPSTLSRSERFRQGQAVLEEQNNRVTSAVLDSTLRSLGINTGQPTIDMSPKPVSPQPATAGIDFKKQQAKDKQLAPFKGKLPAPEALQFPQQPIQSVLNNKVPAPNLVQQTGRGPANASDIPGITEYGIREKAIDDTDIPAIAKLPSRGLNYLAFGNPIGKAISRSFSGNSGASRRDTTNFPMIDKLTDAINDFVTPYITPSGAPLGSGPNMAPYEAVQKVFNTKIGQQYVDYVANSLLTRGLIPKGSQEIAERVARGTITETLAGPLQNVAAGLMNGQDSNKEVINNALIGLGAGLGLGYAGSVAGEVLSPSLSRGLSNVEQADDSISRSTPLDNETSLSREQIISRKYMNDEPLTQEEMDFMIGPEWNSDNLIVKSNAGEGRIPSRSDYSRLESQLPESNPVSPEPAVIGEPILRPGQFEDKSGLGIAAGQRIKPYDSLSTETRSQLVTRQQRDPVSLRNLGNRAYTKLFDDLHPINQQDKILENLMEEPLRASERVHTLGLASRGSDVISKRIITDGLVDSQGQVVGESLKSILSPLKAAMKKNKNIYVDFEDYLINKHAVTRAERGEKVFRDELGWTPEYGAQKAAEYEQIFPEFAEAANKLYAFNRQMVQSWLVDTGIITQDMADAWLKANPYYVPNKRQFTQLEKTGQGPGGSKKGFGNQSNPVKGYQKGGSQRKIISPIEATIENVDAYVKAAKRNQVMQQYVRNIEQAPDAFKDWAEIVKQPEKPADIKNLLLSDVTDESGAVVTDGIDNLLSRFSDDFDAAMQRTRLDKDNIIRAMVNGEPVHVNIKDKQLLSALTALGPESAGWMLNWIGKVTNNMKLLTTGSNPVFSLTRNLFRDIPQAYIASTTRDNPIGFVADLVSAAIDIGGKRGAYKQFLDIGGGHASSIAADRNLLAQSKRAVLPQSGVRTKLARGKEAYENLLNAVEIAPRLAEFKRAFDQTGDLQAALQAAQDITVNFKRRGALSREIDKVFPYFNAAMQGLDKTIRTYKDNPAKALTKSILAITIPTLALYAMNHDDPAYQRLSRRQKDAFLMIPKGDGTFFKVAKPQEQGTIFSDVPERLMQLFAEEDPAAFRDFADRLRTTFTPPGLQGALKSGGVIDRGLGVIGDTILGPFADLAANKNFSGAPIVPGYLKNLSPELQYDAKTTNVAKKFGELTGSSPKQLDYATRQYFGFLAQFGQPLLSPGGDVGSALNQQITSDPVFSNDLSNEFYRYKEKLDQANLDSDQRELPDWYSDSLRKRLGRISKRMSAIREDMRDVQSDEKLSNKEKREELRELQKSINDLAEQGVDLAQGQVPY